MNTKKTILTMFVVGFIGYGLVGAGNAYAQETAARPNMFSTLVEKIAAAFNLDKAKVQEVVTQVESDHRAERQAEMKDRQEEKLSQLVTEGKITEAQKQAIIKKQAEMKAQYSSDAFKNMTQEQRSAAMEKHRTEMNTWADSQGIDPQYLMQGKGGRGFGMKGGFGGMKAQ